jgi:hypothetical protein
MDNPFFVSSAIVDKNQANATENLQRLPMKESSQTVQKLSFEHID